MFSKKIKIEVLSDNRGQDSIFFPKKTYKEDACYDVASRSRTVVRSNSTAAVPLGFIIEVPKNWECQIRPRSGKTLKNRFQVILGTIDCGYTGEAHVLVYNPHDVDIVIKRGERVAQMCIKKIDRTELVAGTVRKNTARGKNGFGSTDKIEK